MFKNRDKVQLQYVYCTKVFKGGGIHRIKEHLSLDGVVVKKKKKQKIEEEIMIVNNNHVNSSLPEGFATHDPSVEDEFVLVSNSKEASTSTSTMVGSISGVVFLKSFDASDTLNYPDSLYDLFKAVG
ncbi:hypothetical protein LINPERHAP1_LOCUS21555 [Linum perenne]